MQIKCYFQYEELKENYRQESESCANTAKNLDCAKRQAASYEKRVGT